jgi:hypothetical protein
VKDSNMSKHLWSRPKLPPGRGVEGIPLGLALIVIGSAAAFFGLNDPAAGVIVTIVGSSAISLGLAMVFAGVIIAEIRQAAFEAAVRAGEVEPASRDPAC